VRVAGQVNTLLRAGAGDTIGIVRLFAVALCTLDSGNLAPIEALWEVFEAIQGAKINHDKFHVFVQLLKTDPDVRAMLSSPKKKVQAVLAAVVNNRLLAYVMMFVAAIKPTAKIPRPFYWANQASIFSLAGAFLPLRSVTIRVSYNDLERLFGEHS
jgi:hypothetical protein